MSLRTPDVTQVFCRLKENEPTHDVARTLVSAAPGLAQGAPPARRSGAPDDTPKRVEISLDPAGGAPWASACATGTSDRAVA